MRRPNGTEPRYGTPHRGNVAYESIREAILTRRLTPGTQLIERALAEEVGVSRTPVRDALARLEVDGLVERVPHVGVFVRKLDIHEALDLLEFRRAIECATAAAAAERAEPEEIERLLRLGSAINEANRREENERCLALEREFHGLVAEFSRNREMQRSLRNTSGIYSTLSPVRKLIGMQDANENVYDHVAVAEAIGTGDPMRALTAMWAHFDSVHQTLTALVKVEEAAASLDANTPG